MYPKTKKRSNLTEPLNSPRLKSVGFAAAQTEPIRRGILKLNDCSLLQVKGAMIGSMASHSLENILLNLHMFGMATS